MTIKALVTRMHEIDEALKEATTAAATEETMVTVSATTLETLTKEVSITQAKLEDIYENAEITCDLDVTG